MNDGVRGTREEVFREVLLRVRPSEEEAAEIVAVADEVMVACMQHGARLGATFEPVLVGSVAKGTFNKNADIDIFLRFTKETSQEEMERFALEVGKRVLPEGRTWYAQHPYVKGIYKDQVVEIVPCYDVRPDKDGLKKMSPVDRTPHHTRFVKEHLPPHMFDDVRVFKQFLKGVGVYGAEIRVQGFAGYLAELVVMRYGGFQKAIDACAEWSRGERLALDDAQLDAAPVFDTSLTFIDPIDVTRNVGSALSNHNFMLFSEACMGFQERPHLRYFFPAPIEQASREFLDEKVSDVDGLLLGVDLPVPDVVEDIFFSQLLKAEKNIVKTCSEHGFLVLRSDFYVREVDDRRRALFLFEFESVRLHPARLHYGPEVGKGDEKGFSRKWSGHEDAVTPPFIKDGVWQVLLKRKYLEAADLFMNELPDLNLGRNLGEEVKRSGFEVLGPEDLVARYPYQLSLFLDTRRSWTR